MKTTIRGLAEEVQEDMREVVEAVETVAIAEIVVVALTEVEVPQEVATTRPIMS